MTNTLLGQAEQKFIEDVLKKIDFFADISVSDLTGVLSAVQRRSFARGTTILRQGEPGDALYILYKGGANVGRKTWFFLPAQTICDLKPGDFIGEMALLEEGARSASVTATADTEAFVLHKKDFDRVLEANPAFAKRIVQLYEQRKTENLRLS